MPILTPQERIGTLLGGKYRVEAVIGRGGMGSVFRGVHEFTGRAVALKVLHPEHTQNAEVAGRFLREARTAAGLKSPNVVDVLDMGNDGDTVFMVLELLEGESLSELLRREGAQTVERAAELLLPVMRAVAMAHRRHIVHRDLKPENIFVHRDLSGAEVPKVLDFGIAKALGNEQDAKVTQTGFVLGTPAYMSPEQAAGIPEYIGAPADVWSMGVVWYETLAAALPFTGPSHTAVLLAVTSGKFTRLTKRLPHLPVRLATAVDKALVRDASKRYPDMGAFLDAIERAIDGAPSHPDDRLSDTAFERASRGSGDAWVLGGTPTPPAPRMELGPTLEPPPPAPRGAPVTDAPPEPAESLHGQIPPVTDNIPAPLVRRKAGSRSLALVGGAVALAFAGGVVVASGILSRTSTPTPPAHAPLRARPAVITPVTPPPPATTDAAVAQTAPVVAPAAPQPTTSPAAPAPPRRRGRHARSDEPTADEIRANPSLILAPSRPSPEPQTAPPSAPPPPPPPPPPPSSSPAPEREHAPMRDYESSP